MENYDTEWLYAELLEQLKEKERQKEQSYYLPLELELPYIEPIGDFKEKDQEDEKRGIIVIEL